MSRLFASALICLSGALPAFTATAAEPPPLAPPDIDAYVDVALGSSDFDALDHSDSPTSYRITAGFLFPNSGTWHWSAEITYDRIGKAERIDVTERQVSFTFPAPGSYTEVRSDAETIDITALAFGVRVGRDIGNAELFLRGGMVHHHTAIKEQIVLSYIPDLNIFPQRPDTVRPSSSETDVGFAPYAAVGAGYRLGDVPTVYVEYATRDVGSDMVDTVSLGVLLNL